MADLSEEGSSSDEEFEDIKDKQFIFIQKLKEHKIVFNKSQVPQVKLEKQAALTILVKQYREIFNVLLTTKQLAKKISNMKAEIKKKFDVNKTGNKPLIYKDWEKLLMDMLDVKKNPVFNKIPGAISVGDDEQMIRDKPSTSSNDIFITKDEACSTTPRKKIKISDKLPETDETRNLSTVELQRLVLLEQLKLCRMQQGEILRRKQESDDTFHVNNVVMENGKKFFQL
ncbi:unnamed protein product [Ceutorhynchus assimilis]|uniref:Uncharacterized protein n=1 Tax=Ceutorhynchus assimilis TaxID=467358 RepID=A0A9N9MYI9_9CUCU|nr:unnamed protein product [Ceutorhynchus assimilis]